MAHIISGVEMNFGVGTVSLKSIKRRQALQAVFRDCERRVSQSPRFSSSKYGPIEPLTSKTKTTFASTTAPKRVRATTWNSTESGFLTRHLYIHNQNLNCYKYIMQPKE